MIQTVRTSFNGIRAASTTFGGIESQVVLAGGVTNFPSITGNALKYLRVNAGETGTEWSSVSGGINWGSIGGTLTDQTDLVTALGLKQPLNTNLTNISGLTLGDIYDSILGIDAVQSGTSGFNLNIIGGVTTTLQFEVGVASDARTSLGLGTISTQNSNNVSLTGGTISGVTVSGYQPVDSDLTSWALVTRASGFDTFATTPSTTNFFSLLTGETGPWRGLATATSLAATSFVRVNADDSVTMRSAANFVDDIGGAASTGTGGLVRLNSPTVTTGMTVSGATGVKIANTAGGSVSHRAGLALDFGADYTVDWEPSGNYTIALGGTLITNSAVTISAFGATLTDDADAAAARTTLGLGSSSAVTFGSITIGTLSYSDTNTLVSAQSSVNSYNQLILQNSNAGATASTNIIVSNDQGTATTNYGEFGMNSSGFTGASIFSQPGYIYVTATSRDLAIGTTTSNAIHFVVNGGSADSMTISSGGLVSVASNLVEGYTTTATAASTTTLTVTSTYQQFFTGSTTQTVSLPVTSTLALGHSFLVINNSTGLVTVNSSGGNAVIVLAGGTSAVVTCILTSGTTAASWSTAYLGLSSASGKKLTVSNTLTLAGTDGTTMTFPSTSATIARTDAANTFTGVQTMTSPATTTSITTSSASFTAWAGATTLLTLGGTGASASTNFPSTLNSTSSTTGAVRTAGGLSCAKDLWVGGVANSPNFRPGYTTTATAAGTTTLTVSSNNQQYFTGSTTQTVVMPVTSTLVLGQSWNLVNNSTGIVTVNSSGSNPIAYLLPNTSVVITCILTSGTTAASWSAQRAISLWTPAAIASKIKQFQQIILGNIFTDTACTTAATTNAQTVKGVTPRFGSGPNFTDTTGATLQGIGSLPYLDHSGATLLSSASTITLSGKFVRYFVLRLASGTPGFLFKHNNDYIFDTGGTVYVSRTAYFQQDAATGWLTTGSIVMVKHKCGGNGIQSFLSVNNVPVSFNAIPTGNPGNVTQNSTMEVPGSTINYAHRLYLWAHFDSLQAHEEAAMDAWIRDEYGLTF